VEKVVLRMRRRGLSGHLVAFTLSAAFVSACAGARTSSRTTATTTNMASVSATDAASANATPASRRPGESVTTRSRHDFGDSSRHAELREPSPRVVAAASRAGSMPVRSAVQVRSPVVQSWESVRSSVSIAWVLLAVPFPFRKSITPSTARDQDAPVTPLGGKVTENSPASLIAGPRRGHLIETPSSKVEASSHVRLYRMRSPCKNRRPSSRFRTSTESCSASRRTCSPYS
jgi:hypothetical protein